MIERLQKLSAEIFKAALKTYTIKDVLAYKKTHANSLTEIFSLFPNQGVGFFAFRKNADKTYFEIKRAEYKSHRHGHFYGVQHYKSPSGKEITTKERPIRLHGLSKRGIWTYSVGNFEQCKVNNGVVYNKADIEAFIRVRGIGMTKEVKEKPEEVQQAEGEVQAEAEE